MKIWMLKVAVYVLVVVIAAERAEALQYCWDVHIEGGSDGPGSARTVAEDADGNVVMAGYFANTIDLGGGPIVSAGSYDIFVAKYDEEGNFIWANQYGDAYDQEAYEVVIDTEGNIILTGGFCGTLDFGGEPLDGTSSVPRNFLAKFNASGQHIWSHHYPAQGYLEANGYSCGWGSHIAIDVTGNIAYHEHWHHYAPEYVEGEYETLWKINANGLPIWTSRILFYTYDYTDGDLSLMSVGLTNDGSVVAVGEIRGSALLGTVTSEGYYDWYVVSGRSGWWDLITISFGTAREFQWSETYGDSYQVRVMDAAVTADGQVAVVGKFNGNIDFGDNLLSSNGGMDGFVATFDTAGDHAWSRSFGDEEDQEIDLVARPNLETVYIAGRFKGDIDFGGGIRINDDGVNDYFLAAFNENGDYLEDLHFPGSVVFHLYPWTKGVASRSGECVYLTGDLWGNIDFGGGAITADYHDLFLVKFGHATTAVSEKLLSGSAELYMNYPNPFNPQTAISFWLSRNQWTSVGIYELSGQKVTILANEVFPSGEHTLLWDGRDIHGRAMPSGTYFVRLETESGVEARKVMLLR